MKKVLKLLIILPVVMLVCLLTGCKNIKDNDFSVQKTATSYFHKGVYKSSLLDDDNLNNDYFYVFYDEKSGHTEDSEFGNGLPFSCIQIKDSVRFRFGGVDEPEEILTIQSIEGDKITGSFKDGLVHEFVFIPTANPDKFDAVEYIKKGK